MCSRSGSSPRQTARGERERVNVERSQAARVRPRRCCLFWRRCWTRCCLLPEQRGTRLFHLRTNSSISEMIPVHRRMNNPTSAVFLSEQHNHCALKRALAERLVAQYPLDPHRRGLCGVSARKNVVDIPLKPVRVDVTGFVLLHRKLRAVPVYTLSGLIVVGQDCDVLDILLDLLVVHR